MKKILFTIVLLALVITTKAQQLQTFCQCNSGSYVRAMAHDKTNGIIYLGGNFTSMCGTSRIRLAAVDASTGALITTFTPPFVNGDIYGLAYSHNHLYIAGNFTTVGGLSRSYLACINTITNAVTNWDPNSDFTVLSLATYKDKVLIGGMFSSVGGSSRKCLAEVDTINGTATSWQPDAQGGSNPRVEAFCLSGDTLFTGGSFTIISSAGRNNAAAFDMTTGNLLNWDPNANGEVYTIDNSNTSVYIGGGITGAGTFTNNGIVKVDRNLGVVDTTWKPVITGVFENVTAIHIKGSRVYFGGSFDHVNGISTNRLVAVDATSSALASFSPNVICNNGTTLQVSAITSTANKLIFTGDLTSVLSTTKAGAAAVCINPINMPSSFSSGLTTVCKGLNNTPYSVISSNGATSYNWSYTGTGATITGNTNSVAVSYSTNATAGNMIVTATNGCETSWPVDTAISVYTFTLTTNPTTSNITCGDTVHFANTKTYLGNGTVSYTWTPTTGLSATHILNPNSNPLTTKNYTLMAVSSEGCADSVNLTVNVTPIYLHPPTNHTIECGQQYTITSTTNYNYNYNYNDYTIVWSPATALTNSAVISPVANPILTTTYVAHITTPLGCNAKDSIMLTVNPFIITAPTSYSMICGTPVTLSAVNDYQGLDTLTYSWSPPEDLSTGTSINPIASPTATTNYTVIASDANGCSGSTVVAVNVNQLTVSTPGTIPYYCGTPQQITTTANSSSANLSYTWTPTNGLNNTAISNPIANVSSNSTYTITMSIPTSGCAVATNTVSFALQQPATQQLCMVTVDSLSTHNILYWEKTPSTTIDSFLIYREDVTNIYSYIGAVSYDSLSEFHDYGVNPNTTTKRYKISVKDTCGMESVLSNYHNTIYIVDVGNGQYLWNPLYTIENTTNPVSNYVLMRDDNNTGNFQQIAITAGTSNTLNDVNYASYPNANWRVDALGFNCNPSQRLANGNNNTFAAKVKSHSNQNNNRVSGIKQITSADLVNIYPNPASNVLNIAFANATKMISIEITSLLGEDVLTCNQTAISNNLSIDISGLANGTYLVQIITNNSSQIKKIVKQ